MWESPFLHEGIGGDAHAWWFLKHSKKTPTEISESRWSVLPKLVHQVRDWFSGVAIKMGRRQDATKEHI